MIVNKSQVVYEVVERVTIEIQNEIMGIGPGLFICEIFLDLKIKLYFLPVIVFTR